MLTGNRKNRTRETGHEYEVGRGIQRDSTTVETLCVNIINENQPIPQMNETTLPVEMSCVNISNESQLIPQMAPTSSPVTKTINTTLRNIVQTTACALPAAVKVTPQISRGTESSNEQPDADDQLTSVAKTRHIEPTSTTGNNREPRTLGIMEKDSDKPEQDK